MSALVCRRRHGVCLCFSNSSNVRQSSHICGWSGSMGAILPPGDLKVVQLQMAKQRELSGLEPMTLLYCVTHYIEMN